MQKHGLILIAAIGMLAALTGGCRSDAGLSLYNSEFQQVVRESSDRVFPAVVYLKVIREDLQGGKESAAAVTGSGVLISADGELLTNFHVIDKAREIRCLLHDGSAFTAKIVGSDKDLDLALLKLERPAGAAPLPFARLAAERVVEGDFVMAMGAPWGLARSVSIGIISCSRRYLPANGEYSLWYQTDASISPGNSGGPLVNTRSEVVGINTLGALTGGTLGFTIPSPVIIAVLPRLREYSKVNWAWFGFRLQPLHDFDLNIYFNYTEGVMIAGTEPGSPARRAGFQPHDRILAIDGKAVTALNQEDLPELRRRLGLFPFDREVRFTVARNGQTLELTAAPHAKGVVEGGAIAFPRWGFTAKEINRFDTPNLYFYCNEGVFVYGIDNFGNAVNARLVQHDIIKAVDGTSVATLDELRAVYDRSLREIDRKNRISIDILRNGIPRRIVLDYLNDYNKEQP